MQQQVGDLVRTGLAQLPDKYRLPLVYTSIEGLDHATVAAMLGVPRGTVKTLVFRGKQMLKQWIVDEFDARPARCSRVPSRDLCPLPTSSRTS